MTHEEHYTIPQMSLVTAQCSLVIHEPKGRASLNYNNAASYYAVHKSCVILVSGRIFLASYRKILKSCDEQLTLAEYMVVFECGCRKRKGMIIAPFGES
jgi:hypothetical protein